MNLKTIDCLSIDSDLEAMKTVNYQHGGLPLDEVPVYVIMSDGTKYAIKSSEIDSVDNKAECFKLYLGDKLL